MPNFDAESSAAPRLARWFAALAAVTWVQIAFGALVRAKKAGLACPDWPLCHGALVPNLKLTGVVYEYGHRLFALIVSAVFAWCAVQTFRHPRAKAVVAPLVKALGAILLVQIVFGGLTVLIVHRGDGDPRPAAWTVATHLVLGNLFAALSLVAALRLRGAAVQPPVAGRAILAAWTAALFGQFLLGGAIAGNIAGLVCTEFPTCYGGQWFPTFDGFVGLQILHRLNAYALIGLAFLLVGRWRRHPQLGKVAAALAGLVLCQAAAGAVNIFSFLHAAVTTAHSLLAALLFSATAAAWAMVHESAAKKLL